MHARSHSIRYFALALVATCICGVLVLALCLDLDLSADSPLQIMRFGLAKATSAPPLVVQSRSCDRCDVSPEWCARFGSRNMDLVQAYEGSGDRIRRVLAKSMRGEPISFGILGGSLSLGHGCKCTHFHRQVFDWWNATFPHPGNVYKNGAVGARGTNYFKFCFMNHLPDPQPDVILVEQSINDLPTEANAKNMESILRQLLALPSSPAVILTASFSLMNPNPMAMGGDAHLPVAQYYDVPVINLRNALLPVIQSRPETVEDFFVIKSMKPDYIDRLHLNGAGHEALAQSTIAFLERQKCLLERPPTTRAPSEAHFAPSYAPDALPRLSLLSNTWSASALAPPERPSCASVDSPVHHLTPLPSTRGWALWTQPGTSKTYWRADEPGARIDFSVYLAQGHVMLYHLKSMSMGLGRVRCWVDEEEETGVVLDGYWPQQQSIGWHYDVRHEAFDTPGQHTVHCQLLERDHRPDEGRGTTFLIIAVLTI